MFTVHCKCYIGTFFGTYSTVIVSKSQVQFFYCSQQFLPGCSSAKGKKYNCSRKTNPSLNVSTPLVTALHRACGRHTAPSEYTPTNLCNPRTLRALREDPRWDDSCQICYAALLCNVFCNGSICNWWRFQCHLSENIQFSSQSKNVLAVKYKKPKAARLLLEKENLHLLAIFFFLNWKVSPSPGWWLS